MEQIYYTQCPIGYGLGASNGFQVKRLSAGYPLTADVRHLGLRAYLAGTRTLVPGSLRYRRDGQVAEIAWLTPRTQEYETERGLWGRPGGHFAHGLRLSPEELRAMGDWPAGLYDRPCWRRSDAEPTRGRPPEPIELGPEALLVRPQFDAVAGLLDLDAEAFARLLTAAAMAVRDGRTLFVIDHAERLGPRLAVLTFAFPASLRRALTFSTFHDRPEELQGFRLQGTTPSARPNLPALASLGRVADLTSGRFDPAISTSAWATTLALWFSRRSPDDQDAWEQTEALARELPDATPVAELWSDAWLEGLFGLAESLQGSSRPPTDPDGWRSLASQTRWARTAGLAGSLATIRGVNWWRDVPSQARKWTEAHETLHQQLQAPETWSAEHDAAEWGEILAGWCSLYRVDLRRRQVETILGKAPAKVHVGLLDGLLRALPAEQTWETLGWLEQSRRVDPSVMIPLKARFAALEARDQASARGVVEVVRQATTTPSIFANVLSILADVAGSQEHPGPLADAVANALEAAKPAVRNAFELWCLKSKSRGGAILLAAYFQHLFATTIHRPDWDALRERIDPPLRPVLAKRVLEITANPMIPREAFLWGVEELLLHLDESERPVDSFWQEWYLQAIASPYPLARRLLDDRHGVAPWLDEAGRRGEVSEEARALLEAGHALRLVVESKDAAPLTTDDLTLVPEADRGPVLGMLLNALAAHSTDPLSTAAPILQRCGAAWAGAFEPGASGLEPIARPLATLLLPFTNDPELWLRALIEVRDRLRGPQPSDQGFEPDGLAGAILAATTDHATHPNVERRRIRTYVLQHPQAWTLLAADVRNDLATLPPARSVEIVQRWDEVIDKATHSDRFFEAILNACDGPQLAFVVPAYVPNLLTLGELAWWPRSSSASLEIRNAREAFVRLIPMAPLLSRHIPRLEEWLTGRPVIRDTNLNEPIPIEPDEPSRLEPLSELAETRWKVLRSLSEFKGHPDSNADRWKLVEKWIGQLPLAALSTDDRHQFVAWTFHELEEPDSDLSLEVEKYAHWLAKTVGIKDLERLRHWPEDLGVSLAQRPDPNKRIAKRLIKEIGHETQA